MYKCLLDLRLNLVSNKNKKIFHLRKKILIMLTKLSLLEEAANLATNQSSLPNPSKVVEALLDLEKAAKKEKINYSFANLIGSWNLRFITGTKKTRKKAGIVLGAGRYIPQLVKIKITYQDDQQPTPNTGRVKNCVKLAFLNFSLTGPVKFIEQKNILAFDFTTMKITIFGFKLYDGSLKGGARKESEFHQTEISQQAFFSYFLIQENFIAARGRGGGLALWSREPSLNNK